MQAFHSCSSVREHVLFRRASLALMLFLSTEVAFSCESQQQVQLLAVITGAILQPGAAPIVVDNATTALGLSTGFASGCSQRSGWFQAN